MSGALSSFGSERIPQKKHKDNFPTSLSLKLIQYNPWWQGGYDTEKQDWETTEQVDTHR